jgi:hypothetical protein
MAIKGIERVVVFIQENHTVDNYFRDMAAYGANVVADWPLTPNPPVVEPPHDRHAYFRWLTEGKAAQLQFDTTRDIPYYLYLATTGAFLENHCSGFGTNSTPNHLILVGGQTPTLKNPSSRQAEPVWDMPSVMGLAEEKGVSWRCYAGSHNYPVGFYKQLQGSPNIVPSSQFATDAAAGALPSLVYVWHNSPFDEHPRSNVNEGMKLIWRSIDAIVSSGGWEKTVFLLTWGRLGRLCRPRRHAHHRVHPRQRAARLRAAGAAADVRRTRQAGHRQPLVQPRLGAQDRDAVARTAPARRSPRRPRCGSRGPRRSRDEAQPTATGLRKEDSDPQAANAHARAPRDSARASEGAAPGGPRVPAWRTPAATPRRRHASPPARAAERGAQRPSSSNAAISANCRPETQGRAAALTPVSQPEAQPDFLNTANGIRTRVTAVRGRRPSPLDDGGLVPRTAFSRLSKGRHRADPRTGPAQPASGAISSLSPTRMWRNW